MGLLKNILGAFVEFKDSDTQKEPEQEAKATNNINTPNNPVTVPTATTYTPSVAPADPSSLAVYEKHFNELIEEANVKNPIFSGTDFKEFMDSKADVDAIADEPTKYITAFNVLKRTGLTKEKLVSTGLEYINVIDRDVKSFEEAFNKKYSADVVQKEQTMQQKAQELKTLTEKINALNQQIEQMRQEIDKSKEKLDANKNLFIQASVNKKNEIQTELQKIKQYFS